ncbi:DUF6286 domain-containing protein [Streptomyces sp. NPDC095817]|uniref:DUF6286 domain-containing protein n=1 Tax=Streptomyces sp. NPDC095817 TaxID=3155082 RepID=UPI0033165361
MTSNTAQTPATAQESTLTDSGQAEPAEDAKEGTHRSRQPWSARRIPAALAALVIAAGGGMLLFDVSRVRAGAHAAAWRSSLARELTTRPLDDVWVLTGAAVAAALGLLLLFLALTPGLRHQLPLNAPAGQAQMRAALDRDAAALLLRDAALRVPGISRARVRVRRHRIKARADTRFRDAVEVKNELATALTHERDQLALGRPPRLAIRLRQK